MHNYTRLAFTYTMCNYVTNFCVIIILSGNTLYQIHYGTNVPITEHNYLQVERE